jgi:glycosyltransferase involved in cell wall biosynthesis
MLEQRALPRSIPIVSDYDDAVFHRYDQHKNPLIRLLLGKKIDHVMANSALVTAGNAYLLNRAKVAGARNIEIVPTVVNVDLYQTASTPVTDRKLRIGWIGTPETWGKYGAPRTSFFRGLALNSGAVFSLVGAKLEQSTEDVFEFVPWSEATEISAIQRMDIGIMPLIDHPWERGKCGYKLIQYMACGLPVVASPVGVNTSIIEHGVNGFLAESDDEWRDALTTLLADSALRKRMGAAGRNKVISTYSIQAQGPRVSSLLAKIACS